MDDNAYPVAGSGDLARLSRLFAFREREAHRLADGKTVSFVSEFVTPECETELAAAALGGFDLSRRALWWEPVLVVSSFRPGAVGHPVSLIEPTCENGRRWPKRETASAVKTAWRIRVKYWRIDTEHKRKRGAPRPSARQLASMSVTELKEFVDLPLSSVFPQRGLDIGLFECLLPERPGEVIPDE